MIIILAGALGASALIVYLLFRQLRKLTWQLTQLRVERDCERILRAFGMPHVEINLTEKGAAQEHTSATTPVRRKRHLTLYLGGSVAAFLASRRHQRHLATAAGTAAFAAAAMIAALIAGPGQQMPGLDDSPPPILAPGHSSASDSQPPARSSPPAPTAGSQRQAPQTPDDHRIQQVSRISTPPRTAAPSTPPSAIPGTTGPPRPTPSAGPTTAPQPPPSSSPSSAPATSLCVDVRTLVDVGLCAGG